MKCCQLLSKKDKCRMFMYCSLLFVCVVSICFLVYIFLLARRPDYNISNTVNVRSDLLARRLPNNNNISKKYMRTDFEIYFARFGKKYQMEEFWKRYENFKNSQNEIEYLNRPYHDGPRFGLTKFSDMSPEEFADAMLMDGLNVLVPECRERDKHCLDHHQNQAHESHDNKDKEYEIPLKFDWRDEGKVGPVLDQKKYCQNCWAFTIIGVMESMLLISKETNAYSRLSVQELTDCSTYTYKCNISSLVAAVTFICNKRWPIVPESEYPLTLKNQNCSFARPTEGAVITRFQVKCDMSPEDIVQIIANHGPVAATVNARPWRNYLGGVIQYHCSGEWDQINHAVQIVGYDMSAPIPYFIIRNSWGPDFGDKGYVYVAMDNFMCAIGRQITFFNATLIRSKD